MTTNLMCSGIRENSGRRCRILFQPLPLFTLLIVAVGGCTETKRDAAPASSPPAAVKPETAGSQPKQKPAVSPTDEPPGELESEKQSDIKLHVVDADQYAAVIKGHAGKVVLVDFWATYCAPCRKQFPHTVEMSRSLAKEGFVAVSMCCDEPEKDAEALAFLRKNHARFENLRSKFGGDEETFTAFEIEGGSLPHYKLYDRQGKLRHTFAADPESEKQFTPEEIEEKAKELLAEKAE